MCQHGLMGMFEHAGPPGREESASLGHGGLEGLGFKGFGSLELRGQGIQRGPDARSSDNKGKTRHQFQDGTQSARLEQ